jgi:chaperonin GroEL
MTKKVITGPSLQTSLLNGVNTIANAVGSTLGPLGRNVVIETPYGATTVTKDGVTVAQQITLEDPLENLAVQIIKQASERTASIAGDGPQPLYSKVLTPTGWTTLGELKVGDTICGTNGTTQKVVGFYPKGPLPLYKVIFSDGRTVECSEDHLWTVTTNYGKQKTLPLSELINQGLSLINDDGHNKYKFFVQTTEVEFDEKPLPLDPYFLGVLLGDGSLSGSGAIELSLGLKKAHILQKLLLPEGMSFTIALDESKNYIRVRFQGADKNGKNLKDILLDLNLLGTHSATKFIPDLYLYSSLKSREALLQGLVDTDGHVNLRGKFEFSTISDQLSANFQDLVRSLGIQTHYTKLDRTYSGGYSVNPVHRIVELKGYKHGIKIVDVQPQNRFEEMVCIKVSNDDHLYITDEYVVTHNTTTATVLAQKLYSEALKLVNSGVAPIHIKNDYEAYLKAIAPLIDDNTLQITTPQDTYQIALISANNDPTIASLISTAIEYVGKDGSITLEESKTGESYVELVDGTSFERPYASPYFVTNPPKGTAELTNPLIFITDKKLRYNQELLPVLNLAADNSRPLVIIADDIEGQALQTLVINKLRGTIEVLAIRAPSYGENRLEVLKDLAALTSANLITELSGTRIEDVKLTDLGEAAKVISSRHQTIIVDGVQDPTQIEARASTITQLLAQHQPDSYFYKQLSTRLAKLTAKVAVLNVGAPTETELKERKARVDDALRATTAAIKTGFVVGGGTLLAKLSTTLPNDLSSKAFALALQEPLRRIAENAGQSPSLVLSKVLENPSISFGYNALTDSYTDLIEDKVIDPALVVKQALLSAVSAANMLILSSTAVYNVDRTPPYSPGSLNDFESHES